MLVYLKIGSESNDKIIANTANTEKTLKACVNKGGKIIVLIKSQKSDKKEIVTDV